MIYSYVITSLPEEAQVYNNKLCPPSTALSLLHWLVGARGTYCSLLPISYSSLGDSCASRAEGDGPANAWLVETVGFVGWFAADGISS